eukprot:12819528-Alexandrium_andersonii.AAC.1
MCCIEATAPRPPMVSERRHWALACLVLPEAAAPSWLSAEKSPASTGVGIGPSGEAVPTVLR